ncbi:MAG: sigma-54-dependent Fis family transcriptional regulator [Desulfuromonadales bacterium]|nr:sigma-54-dependent Fis family transcriptional regulator [Desulfuromonadales bacterium]
MTPRILVCDDEEGMRRYLLKMLGGWGYQVETFAGPLALLRFLQEAEGGGDLLLLDIKMPELDGIETLRRVKGVQPELPVIIMTGHGTIESAVEAMKLGAYDYLAKPFPQEKLFALVQHCLEREQLLEENLSLRRELRERSPQTALIYQSAAFGEVHDLALRVAGSDSSVLILGESGTGKELIAAAIHQASGRGGRRMLAINCAALSETLLESQLFGHLRGAFTGAVQNQRGLLEEAHGSTLFLDEVGDLSPNLQAKLLRVLQEGEFIPVGANRPRRVDVRFVAATNKDLEKEVRQGNFREDLYYRLNVIGLQLPPLRQRREDIEPLARHFLAAAARKARRPVKAISPEALTAMQAYHWPGNVRELENVIERAFVLCNKKVIGMEHLPDELTAHRKPGSLPSGIKEARNLIDSQTIRTALEQSGYNRLATARALGIQKSTLFRIIKRLGISLPEQDGRSAAGNKHAQG